MDKASTPKRLIELRPATIALKRGIVQNRIRPGYRSSSTIKKPNTEESIDLFYIGGNEYITKRSLSMESVQILMRVMSGSKAHYSGVQ